MNLVRLLPVGKVDGSLLAYLRQSIPGTLRVRCEVLSTPLDPALAYHSERQQFHSSELLQQMHTSFRYEEWRLLAIADVDLYIPILQYVFGEAQIGGPCAVVSTFRLRQEFYGLDRDDSLLRQRLLKECLHEIGHTLELRHCEDYRCVMASSHAVEWIDLREGSFCHACRAQVRSSRSPAPAR